MPIRSISSALTASLKNNDPFNYAHLIKFERPTLNTGDGIGSLKSNTFSQKVCISVPLSAPILKIISLGVG